MIRTQIQLTDDQHSKLRRWAQSRGISLSEAVRRCVDDRLAAEPAEHTRVYRVREASVVFGKYADPGGSSRVAKDHDEHLNDAYGQ
jgi:hypothetical protein